MGRVAAVDWGQVRIGLALSDERQILASPLEPLLRQKTLPATAQALLARFSSYTVEKIVIGLPLHLDGKESPLSKEVRTFASLLNTLTAISVELLDERLTTAQAERALKEQGLSRKKRASRIDSASAVILLQTTLDALASKRHLNQDDAF